MKMRAEALGRAKACSSILNEALQDEEHSQIRQAYLRLQLADGDSGANPVDIRSLECAGEKLDVACPITLYRAAIEPFVRAELGRKLRPFNALGTKESREACVTKYLAAEERCHEYNDYFLSGEWEHSPVSDVIRLARKIIKNVLGPFYWSSVIQDGWNGPGSTFGTRDGKTADFYKFVDLPYLGTADLLADRELLYRLVWQNRQWRRAILKHRSIAPLKELPEYAAVRSSRSAFDFYFPYIFAEVEGNRFSTVPKETAIDRPITIEPMLNMMVQKGIGQQIRKALATNGLILDDWQEVQRRLVTVNGNATIDLSSASDTICYELVRLLLPRNWMEALIKCRSAQTLLDDAWFENQKFSGMGNGFTFELESLIFWALATATVRRRRLPSLADIHSHPMDASVFGDDIIVSDAAAEAVQFTLTECGFLVNARKSFSGSKVLRESCGEYTVLGRSIRVFHLKKLDTVGDVYVAYNQNRNLIDFYSQFGYDELVSDLESLNAEILGILTRRGSVNWVPYGLGYDLGLWDRVKFQTLPKSPLIYRRNTRWWKEWHRKRGRTFSVSRDYPAIVVRCRTTQSITFNGNVHFRLISDMRSGRRVDITKRNTVEVRYVDRVLPIDQLRSYLVEDLAA